MASWYCNPRTRFHVVRSLGWLFLRERSGWKLIIRLGACLTQSCPRKSLSHSHSFLHSFWWLWLIQYHHICEGLLLVHLVQTFLCLLCFMRHPDIENFSKHQASSLTSYLIHLRLCSMRDSWRAYLRPKPLWNLQSFQYKDWKYTTCNSYSWQKAPFFL